MTKLDLPHLLLTIIIAFASCASSQTVGNSTFDVLEYINPLIGTNNGGNVFPGPTLPYGIAKACPDVTGQNTGGFSTDGTPIVGFSMLHDSGTGGNPSLGNFPLFPSVCQLPGDGVSADAECKYPKSARVAGYDNQTLDVRPGYFGVKLESGIAVEMTVAERTAIYRFDFSQAILSNSNSTNMTTGLPHILLDLTDQQDSRQNASINIDEQNRRITASGVFLPSFGTGTYEVHTCVDFFADGNVADSGIWVNNRSGTTPKELFVTRGFNNFYLNAGGFLRFGLNTTTGPSIITARQGISFISVEKACQTAETEIPDPVNQFNQTVITIEEAWRTKLAPITIVPGNVSKEMQTNFWSAVYRTMMSPQNYTGENPHWDSPVYYDSFYCLWDQFRSQLPMLTILDPEVYTDMLNSLLYTYQNEGWLPDCRMSNSKGWTQGGSNADVVLVDAYFKNLTGVDWNLAWEAMVNDAENEPLQWNYQGRGGLMSWKSLNYIPYLDFDYLGFGTNSRSISRTLEYAYNDYCIGTFGRANGKSNYTTYLARASNWKNLFKADQNSTINGTDTGFTGFFQPRNLNGTWAYQNPIACSPIADFCSLTSNPSETFESSVWEYQFFVPQDFALLIETLGGDAAFVNRLDYFHDSPLVDIGNEPVFLSVFAYHYAGRPGLSSNRSHFYIPSRFNASTTGLPGNDDSGAMGSFTAFNMMGLFPNPGQNVYLIIPPYFPSVSIKHPITGNVATIRAEGFDASYRNKYVQNATLNGISYTRSWIGHEFFLDGGELVLYLGDSESEWGTKRADRPPSLSDANSTLSSMKVSQSRDRIVPVNVLGYEHVI